MTSIMFKDVPEKEFQKEKVIVYFSTPDPTSNQ